MSATALPIFGAVLICAGIAFLCLGAVVVLAGSSDNDYLSAIAAGMIGTGLVIAGWIVRSV